MEYLKKYIEIAFIIFSLGIILKYIFNLNFLLLLISGLVFVFYLSLFFRIENIFFKKVLILSSLFTLFLISGFYIAEKSKPKSKILYNSDQTYEFTGRIVNEPEKRESSKRIIFKPESFNNIPVKSDEKIVLITSLSAPFNYGDKISIKGKLQKPKNFQSDKGIEFDYINFLAKDNIFYQIYRPEIELIEKDNSIIGKLFSFKNFFMERVNKKLPSPQAELVGGILLGLKSSLGEQLEIDFRRVGLIHIVVLSGYNITIISVAILAILFFLPLKLRLLTGLIAISIFSILVGSGATVIRASIMSGIAIFGQIFHKKYDVNKALFIAGIIMIFLNPYILLYDPSFQLSFLATYGLINFSDKVKIFLKSLPEKFGFKEIVVSTIATQIAVFPLLSKMIGEISVISLLVNVITLPTIPIAMLLGFLTGLSSLISFYFSFFNTITLLISFLANLNLSYVIKITETFSKLPFATINLPKINWVQTFLIYSFIIIIFNFSPVQICKKVFNVLRLTARKIIRNKRMFPHIKS